MPQHQRNVAELARKLRALCNIVGIDEVALETDLYRRYQLDRRTVKHWLEDSPSSINNHSRMILEKYWQEAHNIPISSYHLSCQWEEFEISLRNWQPMNAPHRINREDVLFDANDLSDITEIERRFICGTYIVYKFSFAAMEKITIEFMAIKPIGGDRKKCAVELYCHPADTEDVSPLSLNGEKRPEIFVGSLFRFGRTYYILVSYKNDDDRRTRFIQFPFLNALAPRPHYGLITGPSANLEEPVASRVIVMRIKQEAEITNDEIAKMKRADLTEILPNIREVLIRDPHVGGQWLMTTDKGKTPSAVTPGSGQTA